jgi:1-deoxy-D-xylulose-5-phosphate reductoisomerase
MSREVIVLGSTGSIGRQTLEVIAAHPGRMTVTALAAARSSATLIEQIDATGVRLVALADPAAAAEVASARPGIEVLAGVEGVRALAGSRADLVVNAVTGAVGLGPTLAALAAGTPVALANKESLIIGGALVVDAAEAAGGREIMLIPIDSEHSAVAQCLLAGLRDEVARVVLTASGGPFRGRSAAELGSVTPAEALAHPTWSMGPVVTINSATMMNKGLELIEAHLLFDLPLDRLDVVVHPQSIVHSFVEFFDGSTVAQLAPPDMRVPIQVALGWPDRLPGAFARFDPMTAGTLTFEPADRTTFRALALAEDAARAGGSHPAVLNAANEVAVEAFLAGRLAFLAIAEVVEEALTAWAGEGAPVPSSEDDVVAADGWARARAAETVARLAGAGA